METFLGKVAGRPTTLLKKGFYHKIFSCKFRETFPRNIIYQAKVNRNSKTDKIRANILPSVSQSINQ